MDRDLVERARAGDQEAFADLVHQTSDTLFGIARRILRDPELAEDALQTALVTIWRKLPHLREAERSAIRVDTGSDGVMGIRPTPAGDARGEPGCRSGA